MYRIEKELKYVEVRAGMASPKLCAYSSSDLMSFEYKDMVKTSFFPESTPFGANYRRKSVFLAFAGNFPSVITPVLANPHVLGELCIGSN